MFTQSQKVTLDSKLDTQLDSPDQVYLSRLVKDFGEVVCSAYSSWPLTQKNCAWALNLLNLLRLYSLGF